MTVGYTIHTKSNGTVSADFASNGPSELNSITRGDSATITIETNTRGGFDTLRLYDEFGGKYTILETLNSEQPYRDHLPAGASVDSLVIGIEPDTELQNDSITGVWALIDGVADSRPSPLNLNRLQLSVTVLADYSDHADHAALETALKV
mgnify:CR=1 FL=1